MVESTGLENRRIERYPGFESLSLRHICPCSARAFFCLMGFCGYFGNVLGTLRKAQGAVCSIGAAVALVFADEFGVLPADHRLGSMS